MRRTGSIIHSWHKGGFGNEGLFFFCCECSCTPWQRDAPVPGVEMMADSKHILAWQPSCKMQSSECGKWVIDGKAEGTLLIESHRADTYMSVLFGVDRGVFPAVWAYYWHIGQPDNQLSTKAELSQCLVAAVSVSAWDHSTPCRMILVHI